MKTNFKFKTHDKVYCPSLGTKVYSLCSTKNAKYSLQIKNPDDLAQNNFLTIEGKYRPSNKFPFVFPATEEWKEKLEALYGEKFEEAPIPPKAVDIIKAMLDVQRSRYVLCLVSNTEESPTLQNSDFDVITDIDEVSGAYISIRDQEFLYAVPFDEETGSIVTQLP